MPIIDSRKIRDQASRYFYNKYYQDRGKEGYGEVEKPDFNDPIVQDEAREFVERYEQPNLVTEYEKKGGKWKESGKRFERYLDTGLFNDPKTNEWYKFDKAIGGRPKVNPYYQSYESISPDKTKKIKYQGPAKGGYDSGLEKEKQNYFAEILKRYLK